LGILLQPTQVENTVRRVFEGRHWWLTPVILATQEAEIRRISVQSQLRAINSIRPYLKNT
jgi:hypothetical protein